MDDTFSLTKCAGGEPAGNRGCDAELESMTSKEACQAVQQKKKNIWDALAEIENPLNTLINAFSSTAEVSSEIQNMLEINIDTTTVINQMASCDNIISQIQTNILRGPSAECITAWAAMGLTPEEIKQASKVGSLTQENKADAKLDCQTNQIIDALSKMDATVDNLAMQEALTEAKGILSGAEVNQKVCNDVNVNMSACKYISQNQCCSQIIQQRQKNLIDKQCALGKWSHITQKNEAKALAMCRMNADSSISDVTSGAITTKTNQSGEAKATGFTSSSMMIIIIIIVLVIAAPLLFKILPLIWKDPEVSKDSEDPEVSEVSEDPEDPRKGERGGKADIKKSATIWKVVDYLTLFAGVICIVLFFITYKKQIKVIDKPFVKCENTLTKGNPERITFKRIKEKLEEDSDIIGFDFFPDDIDSNPAKLHDTQLGLGVYLSYVDKDEDCAPIEDTTKERSVSIIKKQWNWIFLIIGITLVVVGIVGRYFL